MPATLRPTAHLGNGEGGWVGRRDGWHFTLLQTAEYEIMIVNIHVTNSILLSSMKIKSLFPLFREMSNLRIQVKELVLLASNNYRVSL